MNPLEVEGKTRAVLLELCRERGLKATGWKRDRMVAALTGGVEPEPAKKPERARVQERQRPDGQSSGPSLAEKLAERTGACEAQHCTERCETWEPGYKDSFGWQNCVCGHTQHVHAKAAPQAPESR